MDLEEELAAIERLRDEAQAELGGILLRGMKMGSPVAAVDVAELARVLKPLVKALEKHADILRELTKGRLP